MKTSPAFEFPPEQSSVLRKARRLERITISYLASVTIVMYLAMGSSQAMKTAWLEDVLSLVPPIVFLIASRIAVRRPSERFPYGLHRVVSIAFLCASLTLFVMGGWLLVEAIIMLVGREHPTIGAVTFFGQTFWLGWLMLPALVWSAVPPVFLGRMKLPLGEKLHDKVLHADASMNKADWLTATAAMVGVLGIGMGLWWTDAVAAAVISFEILRDGFRHLKEVIFDLMDEAPRTVQRDQPSDLPDRVRRHLKSFPWVNDAAVRMREEGHVYFGEAFVIVSDERDLPEKLHRAARSCTDLDWRVHDLVVMPVSSLEEPSQNGDES